MTQNQIRKLTLNQTELVREFVATYDISPDHISFDGENPTPIFHHEALATIAGRLLDFTSLSVSPTRIEETYAMAKATLTLESGRTVTNFGYCSKGETLSGDKRVEDIPTALDVARVRALRAALRMIGFDPVRAHNARAATEVKTEAATVDGVPNGAAPLGFPDADPRTKDLRFIHAMATELGYINGNDTREYRRQIGIYFPGCTSAGELSDRERAQFIAILRGLVKANHTAALVADADRAGFKRAEILRAETGNL